MVRVLVLAQLTTARLTQHVPDVSEPEDLGSQLYPLSLCKDKSQASPGGDSPLGLLSLPPVVRVDIVLQVLSGWWREMKTVGPTLGCGRKQNFHSLQPHLEALPV